MRELTKQLGWVRRFLAEQERRREAGLPYIPMPDEQNADWLDDLALHVFGLIGIAKPGTTYLGVPIYDPPSVADLEESFLDRLRRLERPRFKQAKLVAAMRRREKATFEKLADIIGGSFKSDPGWRKLARDATKSAREFTIPLAYEAKLGHIYKHRLD